MKNYLLLAVLPLLFINTLPAQNPDSRVTILKDEYKWVDAPEALPKGAMIAVLYGDPSKEGLFTIRVKFPANYKLMPHWHTSVENISVIEGSYYVGGGEEFDESIAMKIDSGGFSAMPAKSPHFIFTKDKAIIQVSALGPLNINYVKESDDPRKK